MPDDRTIEQTLTIAAPRERVFAALTEPAGLCSWWTTRASSDPRTGGAFDYRWDFEDASKDWRQAGEYAEVAQDESLTYPWDAGPGGETTVAFAFATLADGGTELRLRHSGWAGDYAAAEVQGHHVEGWRAHLGNLKSVLEGGPDRRAEMGIKAPSEAGA